MEFLLTLPFPMGCINGLSGNLQDIERGWFTAREIAKLDLNALRKPIIKDLLESKGVPACKL
jgi:predicted DNA-binding helix-hairpin-helix protein